MRSFILPAFLCVMFLGAGCATSRVIEDTRAPEIVIDRFGDVSFRGKRIAPEKVASAVVSARIPKTKKIRILVPEERDHILMRKITDDLHRSGYSPLFVTDKITLSERGPDIIIGAFGNVTLHGKPIDPEKVVTAVILAAIPKTHEILILVQREPDHPLAERMAWQLSNAQYRVAFIPNR